MRTMETSHSEPSQTLIYMSLTLAGPNLDPFPEINHNYSRFG